MWYWSQKSHPKTIMFLWLYICNAQIYKHGWNIHVCAAEVTAEMNLKIQQHCLHIYSCRPITQRCFYQCPKILYFRQICLISWRKRQKETHLYPTFKVYNSPLITKYFVCSYKEGMKSTSIFFYLALCGLTDKDYEENKD